MSLPGPLQFIDQEQSDNSLGPDKSEISPHDQLKYTVKPIRYHGSINRSEVLKYSVKEFLLERERESKLKRLFGQILFTVSQRRGVLRSRRDSSKPLRTSLPPLSSSVLRLVRPSPEEGRCFIEVKVNKIYNYDVFVIVQVDSESFLPPTLHQ